MNSTMTTMDEIPFSYNWNNKLDCKAFTTIRIYNPKKHYAGNKVTCTMHRQEVCTGIIVDVKPFLLSQLNPFMSYLDTGYSVQDCTNLILKMYPKIDFKVKKLAFILIVKEV